MNYKRKIKQVNATKKSLTKAFHQGFHPILVTKKRVKTFYDDQLFQWLLLKYSIISKFWFLPGPKIGGC
ncbi:MAG TPA: hypothetical protein DCS88_01545, partial [Alphaproteobacteria bacterium]|nr:hypothetical protein [Alphaproteobacteria bacterium]